MLNLQNSNQLLNFFIQSYQFSDLLILCDKSRMLRNLLGLTTSRIHHEGQEGALCLCMRVLGEACLSPSWHGINQLGGIGLPLIVLLYWLFNKPSSQVPVEIMLSKHLTTLEHLIRSDLRYRSTSDCNIFPDAQMGPM